MIECNKITRMYEIKNVYAIVYRNIRWFEKYKKYYNVKKGELCNIKKCTYFHIINVSCDRRVRVWRYIWESKLISITVIHI